MRQNRNNYVLIFDLDGTLIDTDEANSLAYQQAVHDVTGIQIPLTESRITRETLQQMLKMDKSTTDEIASYKESIFPKYLSKTVPLPALWMVRHLTDVNVILLTLARRERAKSVLKYYNALSYFNHMYFKEDYEGKAKFEYLRTRVISELDHVILFENDRIMIEQALAVGIPERNIYQKI